MNKPDEFILAIVEFVRHDSHRVHGAHRLFRLEPDFGATSVNYDYAELFERSGPPR